MAEGIIEIDGSDASSITLPLSREDFSGFISGLLGQPQSIDKSFHGAFSVTKDTILNTFHLVDQRVTQQNDSSLVQFVVRIFFSDESSQTLNSLDDFIAYTEVQPLLSVGVTISWTYLIQFQKKEVPEKQTIDLSFGGYSSARGLIGDPWQYDYLGNNNYLGRSSINLHVSHTDRTWGVDIVSLLSGHVKRLLVNPSRTRSFFTRRHNWIGAAFGLTLFIMSLFGSYFTTKRFTGSYRDLVGKISENGSEGSALLNDKLDFLIDSLSSGAWPTFFLILAGFLIVSAIVSTFAGAYVSEKAEQRPNSFVLLSDKATEYKSEIERKTENSWRFLIGTIVGGIAASLIANFIFAVLFGQF